MIRDIKDALLGKTIAGYSIEQDRGSIAFTIKDGNAVKLVVTGDCCSTSWIESLDCPENLQGTVVDVEEIAMPDFGNIDTEHRKNVDVVNYYGLKIVTNRGHCVIDYRNDSNGYYGGSIELQ